MPFDSVSKRTAATVADFAGKSVVLTKAAPQGIVELANPAADVAPPQECRTGEPAAAAHDDVIATSSRSH
ncbi:MAG TPA: hypothetical protein VMH32_24400 [Burkholderiales bacterium]|nr:hypothetical protein [Burkholderiales bacterium]